MRIWWWAGEFENWVGLVGTVFPQDQTVFDSLTLNVLAPPLGAL